MSGFFGAASGLPVGSKIEIFSKVVPKGYLLCDGSRVSKTQYAKLYNVIGDNFKRVTDDYGVVITQDNTKFWLPEFRNSTFTACGRKKYKDISVPYGVYGLIQLKSDSRYITSAFRSSNSISAATITHATKTTGKYFIPVRIKEVVLQNDGNEVDFAFGLSNGAGSKLQISFIKESGVIKQKNFFVIANGFQNLGINQVFNRPEIYLFFDLSLNTAGAVINGVTYNFSVPFYADSIYQIVSDLYCINSSCSIEVGYLPESEMLYSPPAGYSHLFELGSTELIIGERFGADTHDHVVGNTSLTIAQMPAAKFQNIRAGGTNTSFVGQSDVGSSLDTGSGQTHTHTITSSSNLPPHVTTMFAIKYK